MSRRVRWILRGVIGVIALIIVVVAGGLYWLSTSLPQLDGEIRLPGLAAPVIVDRDSHGIPTIRAQSEADGYFALGFVHAQDRLWQMDAERRTAAGRLSEVIGSASLDIDRFIRTLGFFQAAQATYANLSPELQAVLQSYTDGVNAFLENRSGPLPPEFYLLRYEPEPWTPVDSLLWAKLMAMQLSGNWHEELLRARLDQRLTPEEVEALWPPYSKDLPIVISQNLTLDDTAPLKAILDGLPRQLQPKDASNSWVLSGERTATGAPILANDPHLGLTAPGTWYMARMETPSLTITGATAPGVPFVLIGQNEHLAWAFTTTHSDTQDLFIERLSDGSGQSYDTPDGPMDFVVREEVIKVKGEPDHRLTVRESRHGPIMNDAASRSMPSLPQGQLMALAWPALRGDDQTPEALYLMNHAKTLAQFEDALRLFHAPQQTIMYADIAGDIGVMAPARVPIRAAGDGRRPVPGWTGDYDWTGMIPFEELPRAINPASGKLVAANNKLVPDDYPHLITADWPDGDRAARIEEMLAAAPRWDLEQSKDMQLDILSPGALELLPRLLAAPRNPNFQPDAMALMTDWDGRMDRERPEPLIYSAWVWALTELLLADKLGAESSAFQRGNATFLAALLRENPDWCVEAGQSIGAADCDDLIEQALEKAFEALRNGFGRDPLNWRWGDAHTAHFAHPVWSRIPYLGDWIAYGIETSGGNDTVNRASPRFSGEPERRFEDLHGPGMRAIFDLADLDRSLYALAGGQSGNPFSSYYGSLVSDWRDGRYFTIDGRETPEHQLTLAPK